MRLIDADALLEQYGLNDATKYGNKDAEQQAHSYSTLMLYEIADMIEDAPTAYDVEKAERQIKDYFCKVIDKQKGDTVPFDILEYNKAICEIVRKGGVE